jgi:transcriptional regulator with XRE-family HTH domain
MIDHNDTPRRMCALMKIRLHKKLLLREIAKKAGCTKSAVSHWDHGVSEPAAEFRAAYAEALGLSVGQLGKIVYEESVKRGRSK